MTTERITFAAKVSTEGRRIKGSITLAGQRTRRGGEWLEIEPAAIVRADASRIVGRWEHDPHKILGRPGNGTLSLSRSDEGIEYELTDLPKASYADDALELVKGGYVTGSSFEIEGPFRHRYYADPETGERVRVITHIGALTDVSPVGDPAFTNSTAAAFSKESTDMTEVAEEPKVAPEPQPKAPEAPVKSTAAPDDGKTDLYRRAEAYARDQTLDQLAEQMGNIIALGAEMSAAEQDRYDAFSAVYEERKRSEREARDRFERIRIADEMRRGVRPKAPESGLFASDDYKQAFHRFLRGEVTAMEQFAQSIAGDGTQGGYTVPDDFRLKVVETQAAYGGIQNHADLLETGDGRPLPYPTNNDTANSGAVASEGSAPGSGGADFVFGEVMLGAFSVAATGTGNAPLKVSWELLQDSAFDIEGFVARKLGERLGRKAAALYATGVGTTEPFGLLAKTPDSMTATTMFAALVEHHFQVNEAYRNAGNCRWVLSDTTLAKVYGSVDLQGRPLFIPAADASGAGKPAGMLLGYPVQLDQGAGNLVAFGDLKQGYVIRRVRGIQVVVDPYNNTANRQNAYHAWMRTDAAVQDAAAYSVSDYSSVAADAVAS